jgi:hypothetical protein
LCVNLLLKVAQSSALIILISSTVHQSPAKFIQELPKKRGNTRHSGCSGSAPSQAMTFLACPKAVLTPLCLLRGLRGWPRLYLDGPIPGSSAGRIGNVSWQQSLERFRGTAASLKTGFWLGSKQARFAALKVEAGRMRRLGTVTGRCRGWAAGREVHVTHRCLVQEALTRVLRVWQSTLVM